MAIDRQAIEKFLSSNRPDSQDVDSAYAKTYRYCTALLGTVPTDESSAEYALWMLSQGKKIGKAGWGDKTGFIHIVGGKVVWSSGQEFGWSYSGVGSLASGSWLEYTPPVVVDREKLAEKCVAIAAKALRAGACYGAYNILTDAERAELLKEAAGMVSINERDLRSPPEFP